MAKRLLFVHGAGGYVDDRPLADGLGAALGATVDMPEFADDDMSFEGWATPLRFRLKTVAPGDLVIAHSFGASVLLRVLAETPYVPSAMLLAMPDWSREGWDIAEYAFDGIEPKVALTLHHCRDDEVVPVEHLALHAARLPSAITHSHPTGGHQFDGLSDTLARGIRSEGEGPFGGR